MTFILILACVIRYWTGPSKHTEALKVFEGSTERDYVGPLGTSGKQSFFCYKIGKHLTEFGCSCLGLTAYFVSTCYTSSSLAKSLNPSDITGSYGCRKDQGWRDRRHLGCGRKRRYSKPPLPSSIPPPTRFRRLPRPPFPVCRSSPN
jgi:hypothetical protein